MCSTEYSFWYTLTFPLFTKYNMYIYLEIHDSYGPDLLKVSDPPWNFDSHGPQVQLYCHGLWFESWGWSMSLFLTLKFSGGIQTHHIITKSWCLLGDHLTEPRPLYQLLISIVDGYINIQPTSRIPHTILLTFYNVLHNQYKSTLWLGQCCKQILSFW